MEKQKKKKKDNNNKTENFCFWLPPPPPKRVTNCGQKLFQIPALLLTTCNLFFKGVEKENTRV